MEDFLTQALNQLAGAPVMQAIVIACGTFILEDATTLVSALFVAEGKITYITAYAGLASGIALGDMGLYGLGRLLGPRVVAWRIVSPERLQRVSGWYNRNLVAAVLGARFLPGARLPAYLAAGIFRASFPMFAMVAVAASLIWTFLLLTVIVRVGESVMPAMGRHRWTVAVAVIAVLVVVQLVMARRGRRRDSAPPVASAFEFWPPVLFYIPVGFYYAWLVIRYRSFTLPTAANPSIYSGGVVKESKSAILDLVADPARQWVAPYVLVNRGAGEVADLFPEVRQRLFEKGLTYPIVAKPDMGQRGDGVQRIVDESALANYFHHFPEKCAIILQELVPYPHEAGILYYRIPGASEGHIFSITLKEFPAVTGDGVHTLRDLIMADSRAAMMQQVYLRRHGERLDTIPGAGERIALVFAGNHKQGAIFRDGTALATPELLAWVHGIASAIPDFYFGRFDIRFDDLDAFLCGNHGRIVEINGAGAEATHIWDPAMRLHEAYGTLFAQFALLFEIGAANRRRGHKPLGAMQLLRDWRWYLQTAKGYPGSH